MKLSPGGRRTGWDGTDSLTGVPDIFWRSPVHCDHDNGPRRFTDIRQPIMTIRPIIRYPDPRLAIPAQPVTAFDGALRDLATDLLETMHAAPGIGITAPHIGIPLRVAVLDLDAIDGARTYVNPEIIWASPEVIMHQEGSVSMPGVHHDIQRHACIRIGYHDLHGSLQTEESDGLRAVCHQHEIDQLDGLFWIKRLSRLKRDRLIKRFEKVSRGS
jgi:peptide deformylase